MHKGFGISQKAKHDLVTSLDKGIEEHLSNVIAANFKEIQLLAKKCLAAPRFWGALGQSTLLTTFAIWHLALSSTAFSVLFFKTANLHFLEMPNRRRSRPRWRLRRDLCRHKQKARPNMVNCKKIL